MPGKKESEQPRDPDNGVADLDKNTHKGSGLHRSQSSSGPREEPSEIGPHKDFVSINVDLDSLQPILGPEVQNPSSVKDLIAKRFDVPENNPILVTLWMSQKLRNELRWAFRDESLRP
jgi:hypothetical protein